MRSIKVDELKPGMKFSKPVYMDGENLLVPEGIEVKQKDIDRLRRWEVTEVQTEGEILAESGGTSQDRMFYGEGATFEYNKAVDLADNIFIQTNDGGLPDKIDIDEVVENVFQLLIEKPDQLIGPMFQVQNTQHSLSQSAVNCIILAVLIGKNLKLPNYQLVNLATAAFLHDIGMTKIPKAILNKSGALSEKERKVMTTHPIYSYRIITRDLGYAEEVGRTALYHHERWDGKGYPKQLKGKEIPLTSRILSVVDAYEAMVRERPYRDSMIGYRAMRQILNDNSRRFDAEILKVFLKSMGIYPVGSIVILNDGSVAKVVRNQKEVPLRPVVRVLVSSSGRKIPTEQQKEVDLISSSGSFIVKAVSVGEMKKINQKK
ncbi:MAG: HD-GYP domain-containing protein [Spirochaetaceae bacterium]|nr:HD-GYP domain-containing protein [Spirochaetaceae bacterium]MCF7948662.1 HD-GYP domain-containing protein [Spirochaetia bacterium]MCF7950681.1 HD-GYP domain-containing protein [Spirochaetaceae bacterium]